MQATDRFVPRALLLRTMVMVELTSSELHRLIKSLEIEAEAAIENGQDDYADFVLRRVAELREAGR